MMTISKNTEITSNKSLGLYIHIPFCMEKCRYCDFLSFGGFGSKNHLDYVKTLVKEIEFYARQYDSTYYIDTIFIGGGTPSLLDEALISDIIAAIRANFNVINIPEITIESNPKTLKRAKLESYLKMGINRLSIGAQSLDNELLKFMGRIHSVDDFISNYNLARNCGFNNINVDLIFAIPGQTMKVWNETLERVMDLDPEHISFYSLQLEENTTFYNMFIEGELEEICDELDREMYHRALKVIKSMGYTHYEISNAAKDGLECKHNLKYWSLEDYLGIGLGAHSYINGTRFSNHRDYISYLQAGTLIENTNNPFIEWEHQNSIQDDISEYIFTGLRKIQGIDLIDFEMRFGQNLNSLYGTNIKGFIKDHLLEIVNKRLRFTQKGIDISNKVLAEFV